MYIVQKIIRKIRRKLGLPEWYQSETSKVRQLVLPFCVGKGCDIGFGGDKIKKDDCVGIDYELPYAATGADKVDIACDVINEEIPIPDNSFDYVYSSHLIEDFADTTDALRKFTRILKPGGKLILVFPDQKKYEEICRKSGQLLNNRHVHSDMGLKFMHDKMIKLWNDKAVLLFESDRQIDYNVILVYQVNK
jgi:ubiquinone/menaquinone biosynthesis C-methylase UbiE